MKELLAAVEPLGSAKYVRFETLLDPAQMPGQSRGGFEWPYVEGLRLDEAQHDLTLLSVGLYGKQLLPQNGAPLRLVVPWKYGFKSIKSIVKIDLVAEQPSSLWMIAAPNEYGFYANVNPDVPHPRWSQAAEQRIGELKRRPTLPFNGYAEQVTELYTGIDLENSIDFGASLRDNTLASRSLSLLPDFISQGGASMILVVGATGMLGGMIAQQLLAQGKEVRILVRHNSASDAMAAQGMATSAKTLIDAGAQPVYGDMKDRVFAGSGDGGRANRADYGQLGPARRRR